MPALLVSLDGRADLPIDRVLIVVGRHPRCDARLSSRRVSRRHCCLALERDGVLVRDLDSTNGTWINGRRIETGLLHPGNELAIAHLRFRLEFTEATEVTPTRAGRSPCGTGESPRPGSGEVTRSAEVD
jgi:pSer/pThr/pTyr-binding forkhead associated (FHA) protein